MHLAKFFQMSDQNGEAGDGVEEVHEPRRMAQRIVDLLREGK